MTSDYSAAFGGISDNSSSAPPGADTSGQAIGNSLTIESGTVTGAVGGIAGGTNTLAEGNTLTVKGGTVDYEAIGGRSNDGPAIGNFVFIDGGEAHYVTGGYAVGGDATGNTVTLISGKVTGVVWGGSCSPSPCNYVSNILAVQGKDFPVNGVYRFDTLNFTLPADIKANDTMLRVGEDAAFPKTGSTDPTTVTIAMADGATLKAGESVTLIEANTKGGTYTLDITPASTTVTTADGYEFKLTTEGTPATKLVATVTKEPPPPPTPDPTPTPVPYYYSGDNSSPAMGELGLLLSGLALAGVAAPALRRREKQGKKSDTRQ